MSPFIIKSQINLQYIPWDAPLAVDASGTVYRDPILKMEP